MKAIVTVKLNKGHIGAHDPKYTCGGNMNWIKLLVIGLAEQAKRDWANETGVY